MLGAIVLMTLSGAVAAPAVTAHRASTPVLDGVVDAAEWADATHFVSGVGALFARFAPVVPPRPGAPVDLDVDMGVKHDCRRLFFAGTIRDDLLYRFATPPWTPAANAAANNLTREGWPWFGDEVELLVHMDAHSASAAAVPAGLPGDIQLVINAAKSRLGGIGVGEGSIADATSLGGLAGAAAALAPMLARRGA